MGMSKFLIITMISVMLVGFSFDAQGRGYSHHNGGHYYGHGYRYGHGHHGHNDEAAYLFGGLVLGSILTHAYERRHQPYVVHESRVVQNAVVVERRVSRRLFKDRNGNCYEKNFNSAGDELLIELDPNECAW